jgi:beta-lactamase regulating signal transducer with metallopeptidase domain
LDFATLDEIAAGICCLAVLIRLGQFAFGIWSARQMKKNLKSCSNLAILAILARLRQQLRLRRPIQLLVPESAISPWSIGYLKPAIVLPSDLTSHLDEDELTQVLAHELAHVARYDDWAIALQRLLRALFVFHPVVWFVNRRIDIEREIACDDRVIAHWERSEYASCLTKVAELVQLNDSFAVALPLLASKSSLTRRIETMLDTRRSHVPALSIARVSIFALLAGAVALFGLRAPALMASPLADPPPDQIGPIVMTAPDGSSAQFEGDDSQMRKESAFPNGTIVYKEKGRSYIIRDKATIDAAHKLLQPLAELSQQQQELGGKQAQLGEELRKLGEQMSALAESSAKAIMTKDIQEQIRKATEELRTLDLDKKMKSVTAAQAQIAELQAKLGDFQTLFGEARSKMGEEQSELGEQMSKLGQAQGGFGELQGKLGEQQEREAHRVEREMKELIDRAAKRGLATPLD